MIRYKILGLIVVFAATLSNTNVLALGEKTHILINREAARLSEELSSRLHGLGFSNGLDVLLRGSNGTRLTIQEWLEIGGDLEDGHLRYLRHFHDPLKPWDSAGLDLGLVRFDSSVRWMHGQSSSLTAGGSWSWSDARRLYYAALTEYDPVTREALWADLFRGLGQLMHLVVDASVPEHTRNDPHVRGAVKLGNSYERWVSAQHVGSDGREEAFVERYLSEPIAFLPATLAIPVLPEEHATTPAARLIDADRYDGGNPGVTVDPGSFLAPVAAGLAEISNANFFSEDTLRGAYPSPVDTGLIPVNLATPHGRVRRYFSRPAGQGLLPANPLRAECVAEEFRSRGLTVQPPPYPCVDPLVWQQVAAHMLPRAVGYARGMLEYFFRGRLRVDVGLMRQGNPQIRIENLTDEEMSGVFEVFGTLGTNGDALRAPTATVNGGLPVTIKPHRSVKVPVTYRHLSPPTPWQLLVFRGRIGSEDDAVAGQVFSTVHALITATDSVADIPVTCGASVSDRATSEWCSGNANSTQVHSGELIANRSVNVIRRVSLTPRFEGTELVLDQTAVPGGVWERRGDEADPRLYTVRGLPGSTLTVELVDGTRVAWMPAAGIAFDARAEKAYSDTRLGSSPPWYVSATRFAQVRTGSFFPYRVSSLAGYPNPTNIVNDRYSVQELIERTIVRDVGGVDYTQYWTDHANVFWEAPPKGPVKLKEPLKTEYEGLSFGPVPTVPLEVVLERDYTPGELEFLRAFVTSDPPPSRWTVIGRKVP